MNSRTKGTVTHLMASFIILPHSWIPHQVWDDSVVEISDYNVKDRERMLSFFFCAEKISKSSMMKIIY
jgi:hypothetical protein